jgi:hypothetical protein
MVQAFLLDRVHSSLSDTLPRWTGVLSHLHKLIHNIPNEIAMNMYHL